MYAHAHTHAYAKETRIFTGTPEAHKRHQSTGHLLLQAMQTSPEHNRLLLEPPRRNTPLSASFPPNLQLTFLSTLH